MSNKKYFIEAIDDFMSSNNFLDFIEKDEHKNEVVKYWEDFKKKNETNLLTKNGKQILDFMSAHKDDYNNVFKSKDIAEELFVSSRTVSGSMRKLVTDGYVEKLGGNPVTYSISEDGIEIIK